MDPKVISADLSVSPQITPDDVGEAHRLGYRAIVCNRPDGEEPDQPSFHEIEQAATGLGMQARHIPVSGVATDADVEAFRAAMQDLPGPVLAYCRTGTRSATLWSLSQGATLPLSEILAATRAAGYEMAGIVRRIANGGRTSTDTPDASYDIVIVGAGARGLP